MQFSLPGGNGTVFAPSDVVAERVGFEPTVPLPVHLISSQGRYNHFDTAPYCSDIISNTEQKIKPGFFKIRLYNSFNFLYISLDKFAEWVYYILKK